MKSKRPGNNTLQEKPKNPNQEVSIIRIPQRLSNGFRFSEEGSSQHRNSLTQIDGSSVGSIQFNRSSNLSALEEFNNLKLKERQLSEKIASLKSEIVYLRKMLIKCENDGKLKAVKIDQNRDHAIELLIDLIEKKLIKLDLPAPSHSQFLSGVSGNRNLYSGKSQSPDPHKSDRILLDPKSCNSFLKNSCTKSSQLSSGTLRALLRSEHLQK